MEKKEQKQYKKAVDLMHAARNAHTLGKLGTIAGVRLYGAVRPGPLGDVHRILGYWTKKGEEERFPFDTNLLLHLDYAEVKEKDYSVTLKNREVDGPQSMARHPSTEKDFASYPWTKKASSSPRFAPGQTWEDLYDYQIPPETAKKQGFVQPTLEVNTVDDTHAHGVRRPSGRKTKVALDKDGSIRGYKLLKK